MDVDDPRRAYDDLLVTKSRQVLDADEFRVYADSEVASVGYLVVGFVFDGAGRVLLIEQPWAEGWLAPGGALQPGESLEEGVVREVHEETGVKITPRRPHAVDEFTVTNAQTGEVAGWTTVAFEAGADTTTIKDDLGIEEEPINDAAWFDRLPDDLFNPDLAEPVYRRCCADDCSE